MNKITIGSRVQYSAKFLRSIGEYTGDLPFAKGTVTNLINLSKNLVLAEINWKNPNIPAKVNIKNLKLLKDLEVI